MTHLDRQRGTSRSELRKFAFLVGGAFIVIGGIALWRHKSTTTVGILGGLGALLALTGAVVPQSLGPVYGAWMRFAILLSKVTTPIFMAVIYFVVLTPTGWLMRLFGWKGLRPTPVGSAWISRAEGSRASSLERQF